MKEQVFGNIQLGYAIEPKDRSTRLVRQVHGNRIVQPSNEVEEADGVYTFQQKTSIHIFTADCIPLLFFSSDPKAPIAAVHCGWRGALAGIAGKAMDLFNGLPVTVVIGPSIRECCFEVREDFLSAFKQAGYDTHAFELSTHGKIYFKLVDWVISTQLLGAEINREWNICTVCSTPALPSFRRNKATDPHIRSWITLANKDTAL